MNDETQNQDSWHYTENTLTLLSVSVAQIKSILSDGGESVSELTESFIELAETLNKLMTHKTDIDHTDLNKIKQQIEQGIIAFQFYDRISQRLDHVSNSLQHMGGIISDENRRIDPSEWQSFQKQIQEKFTMESERKLFSEILKGVPLEQALEASKSINSDSGDDSIELF
jgi:hypothetical protein